MSATQIVNSKNVIDNREQTDGSRYVTETHITNLGADLTFLYTLQPGMDADQIMMLRRNRINDWYTKNEANVVQAAQGRAPWTHRDFQNALGPVVCKAMLRFFAQFEGSLLALSVQQKDDIRYAYHRYSTAKFIDRPLNAETIEFLNLLKGFSLITQAQVNAVIAAASEI